MKLHAPATARNREPIARVLASVLGDSGRVLEVASGSGEHVVYLAARHPGVHFLPSDPDAAARASIDAHALDAALANVAPAEQLDACADSWPLCDLDGVICINMIHIAPWQACLGLFDRAGEAVKGGGFLFLYGPYVQPDVPTAPSNIAFDKSLRARDPRWGLRDLGDVANEAAARGFAPADVVAMPANNLCVVFRRESGG